MAWLATLTCRVVGVLFVAAGVLTAVFGEPEDQHHNLLHLATGLVALVAGVSRDRSAARTFCVAFGASYLAFGALGYLLGDPQADHLWNVGLLQLAAAEHVFHLVLGGVVLAAGLFTARRPATHDASTNPATAHRAVVGGLLVAAAGVVTMAISGVTFTTAVPPACLSCSSRPVLLPLAGGGGRPCSPVSQPCSSLLATSRAGPSGSCSTRWHRVLSWGCGCSSGERPSPSSPPR